MSALLEETELMTRTLAMIPSELLRVIRNMAPTPNMLLDDKALYNSIKTLIILAFGDADEIAIKTGRGIKCAETPKVQHKKAQAAAEHYLNIVAYKAYGKTDPTDDEPTGTSVWVLALAERQQHDARKVKRRRPRLNHVKNV
jgi:hypothetical protein